MIYCDIDGTLTDNPGAKWGNPNMARIDAIKRLCEKHGVVVWSGNGMQYAVEFCEKYGIRPVAALGKPRKLFDDNQKIRPNGLEQYVASPEDLELHQ